MEYEITTTCPRFLRKATLDANTPMCDIFPCETCCKKDSCGLFSVNGVYYGERFFSGTLGELLAYDEHAASYYITRLEKQCAHPSITKENEGVFRLNLTHGGYILITLSELAHLYESIGRVLDSETMSETPKKTAFENAVSMIDPSERLTKHQMLELYRMSYCSPGLTDEWKAQYLEAVAHNDMKAALSSLRSGNIKYYQNGQMTMLSLVFRQKRQNGEIEIEGDKGFYDILPALREALLTQEHGFEYYLNGGLFND